ncbi:MAG TPA: lipid-binding SYLF domain-containing protein [Candidatus Sulfotelmatobacter sp.]|nr:lipid-binding SYLF domain-containing protein [Candidatus Sulfotelmatobacter sp.]
MSGLTKGKFAITVLATCLGAYVCAQAKSDKNVNANDELTRATQTVQNITSTPADKGVPKEVLSGAKCVAVIPKLIKGAFVVGGEHGDGVASCKTADGNWSGPAPFSVSGVSWGPQIGGKSTDLMMFIMNDEGMQGLMKGHVKLGADVSAAAGPVGRSASADAGYKAGILTYSSSKGAFIGASLNGAELQQDKKLTQQIYGSDVSFSDILQGKAHAQTSEARDFVNAVQNAKETAQSR